MFFLSVIDDVTGKQITFYKIILFLFSVITEHCLFAITVMLGIRTLIY